MENTRKKIILSRFDEQDHQRLSENMESPVQSVLDQLAPHFPDPEKSIQSSLYQLGEDISCIKSNLEKKRPKVTIADLNQKLDLILQLLMKEVSTHPPL